MAVSGISNSMPKNCGMGNMHGGTRKTSLDHQHTETVHQQHKPEKQDQYRGQNIDTKA
ncbi:hypothetical protein ACL02P_11620 [Paenibacillus sp. MB22_1]|uniref:hypothetical protein n=1 Tax=Paenibacillus TaxID=44249 RepID=UPI0039A2F05A